MAYLIEAACGCNKGRIRKNNEDNFVFDGRCLEMYNDGLANPVSMTRRLRRELCVAVFDGMGGEHFGEVASFIAADNMRNTPRKLKDCFIPKRKLLLDLCAKLNDAVVAESKERLTERMGSTMVALEFTRNHVHVCNVGDSRAYRLRSGQFLQMSVDHVEKPRGGDKSGRKTPLTQHLGIDPELYLIEPYIATDELAPEDQYLICSDGLTDMLTDIEISDIMIRNKSEPPEICVSQLIDAAMEKGGKDNITVIVCRVV